MKTKTKYIRVFALLFACYLAGYLGFRLAGEISRYQNKGGDKRNQILARAGSWDELASEMNRNSNSAFFKTVGELQKTKEPILNGIFLPLRELESGFWNCIDQ